MRDVLLFANPIAGRGTGRRIARRIEEALRQAGMSVRCFTESPASIDPARLRGRDERAGPIQPQDVRSGEGDAAVVIGGDGTLRSVAELLIRSFDDSAFPPIAIIPLGTANLMGKHLGLGWSGDTVERVVEAIQRRKIRRIDAAQANGRLFLLMAGVGIDGQVVHELAAVRTGPIDYASYMLPAALALGRYAYPPIRVTIDGQRRFGPRPGIVFVGNVAEYGTGFPLLKHARSDDGLLDVCVLPCGSRREAIQLLMRAALGEHLGVEAAVYATARHVRIDSDTDVPVQVDGDAAGHTPLEIELLERRVPFIVE